MKRVAIGLALALAACTRAPVTSPTSFSWTVDPTFVGQQEVVDAARQHCASRGLQQRQVWHGRTGMDQYRTDFECVSPSAPGTVLQ